MTDQPTYYVRCTDSDCDYSDTKPRDKARMTQNKHDCPACGAGGLAVAPLDTADEDLRESAQAPSDASVTTRRISAD